MTEMRAPLSLILAAIMSSFSLFLRAEAPEVVAVAVT
jgi:hypothetical protein